MTSFLLKIIAVVSMFIDHLGYAMYNSTTDFNLIGRFAFPIFAFQISEGYMHTHSFKKYCVRLFLFAIISQIPFMLFLSLFSTNIYTLNIFFTLFAGLISIYLYDKLTSSHLNKYIKYPLGFLCMICVGTIAQFLNFDYGFFGICIIDIFYLFKNNKIFTSIFFILACIIKYTITMIIYGYSYMYILLCIFTIISIIFISLYNKKQGIKLKYLLYLFYPAHLLIIYFIFK